MNGNGKYYDPDAGGPVRGSHGTSLRLAPPPQESSASTYRKHVISMYVSNKPGVLIRIALVFARRGYNIDSLVVSEGHDPAFSHMTITARGEEQGLSQILSQLNKLVDVVHAKDHTSDDIVRRELALIKVRCAAGSRAEILQVVQMFQCEMLHLTDAQRAEIEKVSGKYAQLKQLIFARWDMVVYYFEKELYANPDQDLNKLWWDLVEKYQLVRRPPNRNQPDWAAKIHFTAAPCYYHNYMLGEMLASQLHHTLVNKVLALKSDKGVSYIGQQKAGQFLRDKVFEAGDLYPWNEMIKRATGEPLTARYFVDQFVK